MSKTNYVCNSSGPTIEELLPELCDQEDTAPLEALQDEEYDPTVLVASSSATEMEESDSSPSTDEMEEEPSTPEMEEEPSTDEMEEESAILSMGFDLALHEQEHEEQSIFADAPELEDGLAHPPSLMKAKSKYQSKKAPPSLRQPAPVHPTCGKRRRTKGKGAP